MPPMSDEELTEIRTGIQHQSAEKGRELALLREVDRLREIERAAVALCESSTTSDPERHRRDWAKMMRITAEDRRKNAESVRKDA